MSKRKVAALIPAHNEAGVIAKTIQSLLKQLDTKDIYVIDDFSDDWTYKVALKYKVRVARLKRNAGKARAMNTAIKFFGLTEHYEYILFMDADTQPSPDFVSRCLPYLEADKQKNISCVVGRVQGLGGSWISKYRIWEYTIAHSVHKQAQSHWNSILVVPGCATIYRAEIFKTMRVPTGTLTEDMDFTFKLHRLGYGNMVFEHDAVVYTQDPQTLRDFVKQVNRWYGGFWQAVRKHELPWGGQNLDYEVALLATEGLLNGFVTLLLLFVLPLLYLHHSLGILKIPLALDLFLFFLPTLVWAAWKTRQKTLPLYFVPFYVIRLLTSLLFLKTFFTAHFSQEKSYVWNTKRFAIKD